MTLDEAIQHSKEVGKDNREDAKYAIENELHDAVIKTCTKCAEEHEQLAEWLEELKEYKELEEKGLLLKLPCKVGDTVYLIDRYVNSREWYLVYGEHRVTDILLNENREPKVRISNTSGSYELSDFGKKVFLTKEETAKAWRRLNEQRE